MESFQTNLRVTEHLRYVDKLSVKIYHSQENNEVILNLENHLFFYVLAFDESWHAELIIHQRSKKKNETI